MIPHSSNHSALGIHQPSHQSSMQQIVIVISLMLLSLIFLWLLPEQSDSKLISNYLPLHMVLETVSVVISAMIFSVGWNAYRHKLPNNILLLASAFFAVGIFDFTHMLSYAGMPDLVTPSGPEKAIDFWLAARLVAALILIYVSFSSWKTVSTASLRYKLLAIAITVVALVHWVVLFHQDWLPTTFVPGAGLTVLKITIEYGLVALYFAAAGRLWFKMHKPLPFNAPALFGAACAMGVSELFFTLYSNVTDIFNFLGHIYKAVAYLFLYRAIVVEAIENPYEKLKMAQNELQATLSAVPDLLFEVDSTGRFINFHTNNPHLLAAPADQIIGQSLTDILPAEAAKTSHEVIQETERYGYSFGKQICLEISGRKHWFELSASRKTVDKWEDPRFVVLSRDITQRKQAEQALIEKEQFYSSIVNNGMALVWMAGLDKGCVYFNQVWLDFTGRTLAQEKGNGWAAGVHPKDLAHCIEIYEDAFDRREAFSMTYRLRRHDGEYRWLIDQGTPRFDEHQEFIGFVGHCFDVTERRRISNTYRTLFQTMGQGVVYHDLEGRITDANLAAQRILGLSLAQMQGHTPLDPQWHTIHPDGMPFPRETHPASITLKSGLPVLDVMMGVKNPKLDHPTWVRVSSIPVFKEDSRDLDYVYATFEDITERQRAENQVNLLSEITENAPDGISLVKSSDGTIYYANRYFEAMLGYGPGELFNKPIASINAPTKKTPEQTAAEIINSLNKYGSWQGEVLNIKKDGTTIWTAARIATLNHPELGVLWVNYQSDITERIKSAEMLKESEKKYRDLIEHFPDVVYIFSTQRGGIYYSPNVEKLLGYSAEYLYAHPYLWNESIHPDDVKKIALAIQKSIKGEPFTIEYRIQDQNGNWKWINDRSTQRVSQTGETIIEGLATDISDRIRDQESLQLAASVFSHATEGIIITNTNGEIIDINKAFSLITGYSREEVLGQNPRMLHSGRHSADFYQKMWAELTSAGNWQGEIWNRRKNGDIFPEWLTINSILNDDGSIKHWVAIFSDITAKKKIEEVVWKQANFDALTGLPNRRMLNDLLAHEIKKHARNKAAFAVMMIDLDRFKDVNDSFGHHMGDSLLKEATQRMRSCLRESDTVARLGGDEFLVILHQVSDSNNAGQVANNILNKLSESFKLGVETAHISASIGVTIYPHDANDVSRLLKNADQAMYTAKQQGKNRFQYYTQAMQEATDKRMRLANDLHVAIEGAQFQVFYQPIIDLASGEIHKAEALIRWQHPKLGMISPADFIPIAEDTGAIIKIGDWVFHQAALFTQHLRTIHSPQFQISVNVSPVQFKSDSLNLHSWFEFMSSHKLTADAIVLEITEGLLMEERVSISNQLLLLRDNGTQVSLDDFGTGYSSLSYLKKFDIDYLKIDQSFVRNLKPQTSDMVLCEAMISMSKKLGIKVIAEGVETQEQSDMLKDMGCDFAQGYLFAKPIPATEFEQLLVKNNSR